MTDDAEPPELSPVTDEDAHFLRETYASTIEDMVASLGWDDDQIHQFVAMQSDTQIASYRQSHPGAEHYIISSGGSRVGRLIIEWTDAALILVDISIMTGSRSGGLGSGLIRRLQKAAAARHLPLRLSVRIDNQRAVDLYERLGFVDYMPEGSSNALYRSMQWIEPG